jgi:hypothetical protein
MPHRCQPHLSNLAKACKRVINQAIKRASKQPCSPIIAMQETPRNALRGLIIGAPLDA